MSEKKTFPGTVVPDDGTENGTFAALRPMIKAASGLTLSQVCAITGLETSTIQNWVKRGFVAHPEAKKYGERHLARIMMISMMRDAMQIDDVGELMRLINGDATDESDDLIPEIELYDLFCAVVRRSSPAASEKELAKIIGEELSKTSTAAVAKKRLTAAVCIMADAYFAGVLARKAKAALTALADGK